MKWFLILLLENERYVHLFDWIRRLRRSVGRSLLDFLISNIPRHVYSTKKVYCTSRLDGVSILVGRPVGRHPELPTNTLLALGARTRGGALCVELLADRWTTRRDFSFLTGVAKGRPYQEGNQGYIQEAVLQEKIATRRREYCVEACALQLNIDEKRCRVWYLKIL